MGAHPLPENPQAANDSFKDRGMALDGLLQSLHADGPPAKRAAAYEQAAGFVGAPEAERFHLTHAYIFALEAGDEVAELRLANRLRALGGL